MKNVIPEAGAGNGNCKKESRIIFSSKIINEVAGR
jgi:hypothetical protein